MERGKGVGAGEEKGERECNLWREIEREMGKKGDRERFDVNKMIFNIIVF